MSSAAFAVFGNMQIPERMRLPEGSRTEPVGAEKGTPRHNPEEELHAGAFSGNTGGISIVKGSGQLRPEQADCPSAAFCIC